MRGMTPGRATFNKWFVGVMAGACFATSAAIAFSSPDDQFWWGGFLRAGVVLVALWFCLPSRDRPAAWEGVRLFPTLILIGAVILTVIRPKVGLPVLLLVLAVRAVSNLFRTRRTARNRPRTETRLRETSDEHAR
jgi:hypothetical protein